MQFSVKYIRTDYFQKNAETELIGTDLFRFTAKNIN